ncbi:hypothetical protein Tco_1392128 [Tanacetum coccineum]
MNALSVYMMEMDEISERYIAPCFMNGLEAFDGEVNLAFDENLISNEFAIKLCLDYELIINPEEDDFAPGVILGRSFLILAQGVVVFGNGVITIYPESDLFEEESEKTGKSSDDWDQLLDFNFDDVPKSGEELPPFVSGRHLTQEEAEKEELAIRISQRYALLEEDYKVELDGRTVKEDEEAVKRIKGEALKEKDNPGAFIFPIRLEGKVNENALAEAMGKLSNVLCQVGVTTIITKFLILDYQSTVMHQDAKSRYNTKLAQLLPRHIYSPCIINWDVLNQMGCDGEIDDMLRIRVMYKEDQIKTIKFRLVDVPQPKKFYIVEFCLKFRIVSKQIELKKMCLMFNFEGGLRKEIFNAPADYWLASVERKNLSLSRSLLYYQDLIYGWDPKMITYGLCQRTTGYDKVQKNNLWLLCMFDARHQNGYTNVAWVIAKWMKRKGVGTQKESQICCGQFISKLARKCRVLTEDVMRSLSALIYYRDLDTITLRDLINSKGKLILEDPQPGVPRVGIPRPPRASMQDLYDRMGRMEIRQDVIERMKDLQLPSHSMLARSMARLLITYPPPTPLHTTTAAQQQDG